METPEAVTQSTSTADVARLIQGAEPVIVRPGDALRHLAEAAAAHPECTVLCVVDDAGRLVGLVRVSELVNDIFLKIVPEEALRDIGEVERALQYAERIGARTAADIMEPPVSVRGDEKVRDAFRRMHESKLDGLPLVDGDGRVIGYLDQLELLLAWVEATGRSAMLEPHDPDA
jgi:CBS domain-containing protein